jgi:hypothetical protein
MVVQRANCMEASGWLGEDGEMRKNPSCCYSEAQVRMFYSTVHIFYGGLSRS